MKKLLPPKQLRFKPIFSVVLVLMFGVTNAQIASDKCKFLGNVIASSIPTDFQQYWNQVTPENAGKWQSLEPTRDNFNWTDLDLSYNYAKNNGLPFKHHTFIWGNQQPLWIESLPAEEQLAEIEEMIQAYCERYPDTDYIDVVNEPINDPPSGATNGNYIEALGGTGTTGYDWVIKSFQMAKQYCPDAKLLLNEYGIINDNNKTNQYLNIINLLKENELIDGIGVQGHRFELENATNATLTANLDKLGATGLPVYISEFDLGNINNEGTPDDAKQRELYERIFPILWNHTSVQGITLWGYRQGETWQQTAFLKRTNGTERPALQWLKTFIPDTYGGTFCYPVTSVEDEDEQFVSTYPNPSPDGSLMLTFKGAYAEGLVRDISGRTVDSFNLTHGESYRFQAQSGIYVLRLKSGNRVVTRKLVIQ